MTRIESQRVPVPQAGEVSALLMQPDAPQALLVLAHGAGAGMNHPFMEAIATALAEHAVASLRFQFPFMEQGCKRTDPPAVAQATVRAAVRAASAWLPQLPLYAGGKSFGGRMTSAAQAESPLPGVRGLVFIGFPLHPAGRAGVARAAHLQAVRCPMLFLQGNRDGLADVDLTVETVRALGDSATLNWFEGADHGFEVLKRSGTTNAAVQNALAASISAWIAQANRAIPAS